MLTGWFILGLTPSREKAVVLRYCFRVSKTATCGVLLEARLDATGSILGGAGPKKAPHLAVCPSISIS
jgi:hypothetical protein